MNNVNPDTMIRYGVISCNSLNPDLVDELMHGPDAVDLDYQFAYAEAKREAESALDLATEEAQIVASEIDPNMYETDREMFIENYLDQKGFGWDYVEQQLERWSDMYQSEEPTIEGEYDGVTYRISWLGGAPLLWVLEGPTGFADRLCSPCVPNAADLDRGFSDEKVDNCQHECYVVPQDWLAKEFA